MEYGRKHFKWMSESYSFALLDKDNKGRYIMGRYITVEINIARNAWNAWKGVKKCVSLKEIV